MKIVSQILAATTLVVASVAFSGAANATVIDFDLGDVPYNGGASPNNYNHYYIEEPFSASQWKWYENYFSEQSLIPGLSDKWVLPELSGNFARARLLTDTGNRWNPGPNGNYGNLHFILRPGYLIDFNWEESWVSFSDGSQYSFLAMNSLPGLLGTYTGNSTGRDPAGSVDTWWKWSMAESPMGDAMPTHVHLSFQPLGVGPTPAVPEPETYAMLLAGLGIVGFVARRRRHLVQR
jgi:hypothetical protein